MTDQARRYLIAILVLAVLLRVVVALYLGDITDAPPLLTDQRSYHALGARLLQGQGYSFADNWYPFTPKDSQTAFWSFLYPVYIAAVYALFGPHPLAVRLTQAILGGLLLPWLIYRLARRANLGDRERVPLIAALCAALYPYFVLYAATLMTETFFICAVLWSLERALALEALLSAPSVEGKALARHALTLGLSLGVATLLRQSVLPWAAALWVYLLWRGWRAGVVRMALPAVVASALIVAAFIAPFTLRNYAVFGRFLLLNSNAGYAMYSAQHPMHGTDFREFDAAPLPPGMWGRSEAELDPELMRMGIGFVLDDPLRYLLLSLSRVRAYFEFWPTPDTSLLNNIGRVASFGVALPFMLAGLWLSARQTPRPWLLYLFIICYSVLHIFTWAMVRYRLPVDAVLLLFAALALDTLVVKFRQRTATDLTRIAT